ncbi:MAG TPA: MBL fold metallo-hydrolase [Candidatus Binataceae bacterium]|jgi:phosphoribosyl 1,2-cyclic phosphodiesterase|nr:MBL fold metallo-hydrolase [Candidatus Binataceae bacterium]
MGVRAKLRDALLAARERRLDSHAAIEDFIDHELPFSVGGTYGGNTSCVELVGGGEEFVLCDAGSGLREFGNGLLARYGPARTHRFNIFMSHLHWDHINGFPFFTPAFIPGNVIRIHGCHEVLREAFVRQQSDPCFPVDFRNLAATIEFVELKPGHTYKIDGLSVRPMLQNHGGDSYGYRFELGGKSVVYSTDCEHKYEVLDKNYPFVEFFRDADVLIFDAMYSLADQISVKEDWGHSSNMIAVELAQLAGVKHLVMFHHEPIHDDPMIERILGETRRYDQISRTGSELIITSAYDGLEIAV